MEAVTVFSLLNHPGLYLGPKNLGEVLDRERHSNQAGT